MSLSDVQIDKSKIEKILSDNLSSQELEIASVRLGLFGKDVITAIEICKMFQIKPNKASEYINTLDRKIFRVLKDYELSDILEFGEID